MVGNGVRNKRKHIKCPKKIEMGVRGDRMDVQYRWGAGGRRGCVKTFLVVIKGVG
jgi:hypothetical protein